MTREILTIKQVADYLQLNEKTIYRILKNREIPCFKVGGSWRFKKSVIEKWIDSLNVFPVAEAQQIACSQLVIGTSIT